MDIQRLRQILNELNPIFWNPEIDRQLEESNYPNQFPIESAKYRHTIALRKLVPRSHHYRKSLENKRFNKLLKEVEKCLSSYDNAFAVLLGEFKSSFAQQVLFTHQKLIGEFVSITQDNYESWTELLVCMSHKDFWAELDSSKTGETKNENVLTGEAKALAMLVEHPDWPDTKIAKAVGVNRTTLYDWPNFKKAKEALKQGQNDLAKGSKNGETGNMEAWDQKD